jgi:hypothetical protein
MCEWWAITVMCVIRRRPLQKEQLRKVAGYETRRAGRKCRWSINLGKEKMTSDTYSTTACFAAMQNTESSTPRRKSDGPALLVPYPWEEVASAGRGTYIETKLLPVLEHERG